MIHWQRVESYIREHADVKFTHGYCPICMSEELGEQRTNELGPEFSRTHVVS